MTAELKFIGQIRTPYKTLEECPKNIRPDGPECEIVLSPEYAQGLVGLQRGQTILILYWFEDTQRSLVMQTRPDRKNQDQVGTFSVRSPHRPNPIAVAQVPIEHMASGKIIVRGMDCLDGTKLLDIKPATR